MCLFHFINANNWERRGGRQPPTVEMNYPKELKYVKSHEWIKEEGDVVVIGITDYAQESLGDLVFVNLPEVGDEVQIGEAFADVESVKAVSDVYSPVTGVVKEINEELIDHPEQVNQDPYQSWMIKVENISEKEELMDCDTYMKFLETDEAKA